MFECDGQFGLLGESFDYFVAIFVDCYCEFVDDCVATFIIAQLFCGIVLLGGLILLLWYIRPLDMAKPQFTQIQREKKSRYMCSYSKSFINFLTRQFIGENN